MNKRVCVPESQVLSNLATAEGQLHEWHERLGNPDKRHVRNALSRFGISVKYCDTASFCHGCVFGKSHRKPVHVPSDRPQKVGELINSDVNGTMSIDFLNGFRYYVVFKNDFSRYVRVFFMKEKSEVSKHFVTFLNECDTASHKVKACCFDGGGEFDCESGRHQLRKRAIELRLTCPDTPE